MTRILWVEDDMDQFAPVVRAIESQLGAKVEPALDLDRALGLVAEPAGPGFDLILVDNLVDGGHTPPLSLARDERDPGCKFALHARAVLDNRVPIVILTFYPPEQELLDQIGLQQNIYLRAKSGRSKAELVELVRERLEARREVVA